MYYYTKDFDVNSAVLMDMLRLSSLKPKLDNIRIGYNPDIDKMGTIEVFMTEVLQSEEEDILIGIINEYSLTCPMQIRYNLETTLINPAMSYGQEILAKFASSNLYLQKTDAQIDALVEGYPELIHSLITGSLTKAYREFASMPANENITQAEIDEFKARLGWFLGI